MNFERIGNFIYKLRKDKNMTQQELAEKLGVTDQAISNWENGKRLPDYVYIQDLCNILDISVLELLSGKKTNKFEDTNEWFLLLIKSFQDGDKEDYRKIKTIVKINNEYKEIYLLLQNKLIISDSQEVITKEIYKNIYVITPFVLIDGNFDYMSNYEDILPLSLPEKSYKEIDKWYYTKEDIINDKLKERLSEYYNPDIVDELFDHIFKYADEKIETDEYYDDMDYHSACISEVHDLEKQYLNDIDNNLERLFVLYSFEDGFIELRHKIFEYINKKD